MTIGYFSQIILYCIASYNFFEQLLFMFGVLTDGDRYDNGDFKEYNMKLIVIRTLFFIVLYLVSIPGLLTKKLENL